MIKVKSKVKSKIKKQYKTILQNQKSKKESKDLKIKVILLC